MAALAIQNIVDTGTAPTFGAASTSDTAEIGNGQNTFLVYKNSGATEDITVAVPGNTFFGIAEPDNVMTLPASPGELWIPLRKEYSDGSGSATVTMGDATGITVALVRMG